MKTKYIYHQLHSQVLLHRSHYLGKAREDLSLHKLFCSIKQRLKRPHDRSGTPFASQSCPYRLTQNMYVFQKEQHLAIDDTVHLEHRTEKPGKDFQSCKGQSLRTQRS